MLLHNMLAAASVAALFLIIGTTGVIGAEGNPHRIVVDTDVDTDDLFALLYLLKHNTSKFQLEVHTCDKISFCCWRFFFFNSEHSDIQLIFLIVFFAIKMIFLTESTWCLLNMQGVTISANSWTNAGHAVNQIYDLLYMMGRDDIAVGVGGEGGILSNSTILPNVGGYLPIIEQVTFYFLFYITFVII
jgi:hypothetical protein